MLVRKILEPKWLVKRKLFFSCFYFIICVIHIFFPRRNGFIPEAVCEIKVIRLVEDSKNGN
jgi:hypothetical protein